MSVEEWAVSTRLVPQKGQLVAVVLGAGRKTALHAPHSMSETVLVSLLSWSAWSWARRSASCTVRATPSLSTAAGISFSWLQYGQRRTVVPGAYSSLAPHLAQENWASALGPPTRTG